ncbi:MAG: response regulator, partial [Elusimicrobiota bacterium]
MNEIKVLIVDDDPIFRFLARTILESASDSICLFTITEAEKGLDGVALVKNNMFDVVIMDLILPDINGLESVKRIREFNKEIAIIMVTGTPSLETSMEADRLNVFEFFEKPFQKDIFIEAIKKACL